MWAPLQVELDKHKIPNFAIDLPGHGASLLPFSSSLNGDAQFVADTIAALALRGYDRLILVGHSYGGAVITQAAVLNSRIAHLFYICALCPALGETTSGANANLEGWVPHPPDGFGSKVVPDPASARYRHSVCRGCYQPTHPLCNDRTARAAWTPARARSFSEREWTPTR